MKRSDRKKHQKNKSEKRRATLRSYIWVSFIVFTFAILVLLWFFQYIMLDTYYSSMKARDLDTISDNISLSAKSDNLQSLEHSVRELSFKNNVCMVITDENGNVEMFENTLGSFSFFEKDIKTNFSIFIYSLKSDLDSGNTDTITKVYDNEQFQSQEFFHVSKFKFKGMEKYLFIESTTELLDSTSAIIKQQLVYITIILFELAFIITLFISKKLSQPIADITKTAKSFAEGDFATEFKSEGYQEVHELADVLNKARKEISKVSDLRKDLIANISHDLRTPLTIIKSYAEMIRDLSGENPEKRQKHINIIIDEIDRLSALVSSLLELSKLESGNLELELADFSVHEKMHEVMQRYRLLVERDGYDITFVPDEDMICRADTAKLDQVIYNLVNNAVNYCGEGKKIVIRQINKDKSVRIEVSDDGDGIAKEKLPLIFDRYYRDERHKRDKVGTGLGLSIVKEILKKHGFPFGVMSEEGKGSTFWFEVAVADDPEIETEKKPVK